MSETAESLAGPHYWCDDSFYSCPLNEEGSSHRTGNMNCDCRRDERVARIQAALDASKAKGAREAWEKCAQVTTSTDLRDPRIPLRMMVKLQGTRDAHLAELATGGGDAD